MAIRDKLEIGRSLKDLTTLSIGGAAQYFIEIETLADMKEILQYCKEESLPFFILGKGSNVFFDDLGYSGVVIANRISFLRREAENMWHVGAGYSFSLLGSQTAREGWAGLEFASGIPASVGGAVYMNAGANGCETSQNLISVDFVTPEGELLYLKREDLSFGYRTSSFQEWKGAIVGATFRLTPSQEARQKQLEIIHYRKKTQPYGEKSAGCVFRNPECAHAGALIEQCGLKGKMIGGSQVSSIHANFLINKHEATANDFLTLIEHVRSQVKQQMGIDLENEIRYIPYTSMQSEKKC